MMAAKKRRGLAKALDGDTRRSRGRVRVDATFPAPPSGLEVPTDYAATLADIQGRIRRERVRVALSANAAMVLLYWDIGSLILDRQDHSGWGSKVIDRLSTDLSSEFPEMRGFSARNLKYMRAFAAAWQDRAFVQEALAQIPLYHNIALLEKLKRPEERLWYAKMVVQEGWSHGVLTQRIELQACRRQGRAINNFDKTMPPEESDLAAQVFKDPYLFDFLGTAEPRREREIEQGLVDHIQRFLLELGAGFAFVGRQVDLEVGDQSFSIDLLFYHLKLRCYVVIELKAVPFDPGFVGQLNLYLSAVDDLLCHPDDKPSIGLLLCRSRNRIVVEYALRHLKRPIGVAEWETRIVESLPDEFKGSLPSVEELEEELSRTSSKESQIGKSKAGKAQSKAGN